MRSTLAKDEGVRKKFEATFSRLGKKKNYHGYAEDTILLIDVIDADTRERVTDHVWFSFTRGFEKISMKEGVILEFEARIKEYVKGYVNPALGVKKRTRDFKLSHPTKIKVKTL
jgi:hypothetical protein